MNIPRRQLLLGGALALTLAAAAWFAAEDLSGQGSSLAEAADSRRAGPEKGGRKNATRPAAGSRRARAAAPADARPAPDPAALQREAIAPRGRNLFATHAPNAPAPRAAAAPPPPPPVAKAPPLPYKLVARMVEERGTVVLLSAGQRTLIAREGDLLDGKYRVDSIGAEAIAFTYQPLAEPQRLSIGKLQ